MVFRARVISGTAAEETGETTKLQWLSPEDAAARCDEAYAVRVTDAVSAGGPAIRAHDGVNVLGESGSVSKPSLP